MRTGVTRLARAVALVARRCLVPIPYHSVWMGNVASVRAMTASPKKKAARAAAAVANTALPLKRLTIALVGCPNVGKSTLFNRLTRTRHAIVNKTAGTTRDWKSGEGQIGDLPLTVIDTGGLDDKDLFGPAMLPHTQRVVTDADVVLFVVDARLGVTPEDQHFAQWVRRQRTGPVVVVANKTDGLLDRADGQDVWDVLSAEVFRLGLGEPIPVSAEHGDGLVDVHDALAPFATPDTSGTQPVEESDDEGKFTEDKRGPLSLAIVGRPNVGKSTLLNQLIGENRVITSPIAGTTRDSIRISWEYKGQRVDIVDTAGIDRLGKWDTNSLIDSVSLAAATKVLSSAGVALLVMEATSPVTKQDLAIAQKVVDEGRPIVVALNKIDTVEDKKTLINAVRDRVQQAVWQAGGLECVPISALQGRNTTNIMPAVVRAYDNWSRHVPSRKLNVWFSLLQRHHPPPALTRTIHRRLPGSTKSIATQSSLNIKYITQVDTRPPTFVLFANRSDVPESYIRFLVNSLREEFGFLGVPVRVHVRGPRSRTQK